MQLRHTAPCQECPWRKASAAGWLGGLDENFYSDAFNAGEVPACHCHDHGPENDKTAFCAGALSVMANSAKQPGERHSGQAGAVAARDVVGKRDDTFRFFHEFHRHHTGEDWVHLLMRTAA